MKILSGRLKGQKIYERLSPGLRPTGDKVRKAVFDILRNVVVDAAVLDLYSGTGALGIEALSSGAASAVFVEMDRLRCLKIRENLQRLGLDSAETLCEDAKRFLARASSANNKFDLILADPPYHEGLAADVLTAAGKHGLVRAGGYLVLESHRAEVLPAQAGALALKIRKVYGDTQVTIFGMPA